MSVESRRSHSLPDTYPRTAPSDRPARAPVPQVLIIDRDAMARRGLTQALSATLCVSGAVGTVREAEYLPAPTPVDVVLVSADVMDMDGVEGIGRLLTRFARARVVVLVAADAADPQLVVSTLRGGADGVLPRDVPPAALQRTVRGVLLGEAAVPRVWVRFVVDALRLGPPAVTIADLSFSPRERDVLSELARGRTNAEIAMALTLKESTVKTHVTSILRKTGTRSRFALQADGRRRSVSA